jgi:hypothetical protein
MYEISAHVRSLQLNNVMLCIRVVLRLLSGLEIAAKNYSILLVLQQTFIIELRVVFKTSVLFIRVLNFRSAF